MNLVYFKATTKKLSYLNKRLLGVGFVAGKGFFVDGGNGNAEMGNIFMTLDLRPYLYPFQ